ncbi:cell wall-associated NlpC family hydrolase [Kitasatospora sp. MAP12-15]|uniref:C40 family peptidase n=1 Tax=unclassified Kitasatospora TaxID=2633591 RepID=UPI0024731909|nr:C40 family peptidase [Kitasatospora sp. MAP12-44]MDH6111268.1 cell wall-associated NlpC family hydrolase [Kitasatospora sp. MAP12-44]
MARRLLTTLLLALTTVTGAAPLGPAAAAPAAVQAVRAPGTDDPADDAYPSTGTIARATAEADQRAEAAAGVETRLAGARAELDQAGRIAEQAVEAYNGAQVRLAKARTDAADASRRSTEAQAARASAAEDAAALAAATYRTGGTPELAAIDALLGSRGPIAVTEQAAAVGAAGTSTRQILDAATSTAAAATAADEAASRAAEQAGRAAAAVEQAKARAQSRLADQQALVTDLTARREHLLGELAAARDTTVELERQRQEALEASAAGQAQEAAKAAASAAAAQEAARHPATERPAAPAAWSEPAAQAAIDFARSTIGLPYIWGGEGPEGYDCSGLTMLAWHQSGKRLTHFAADQYAESTPVDYPQLRPGDLVFWTHTGRAADIYHVAIYLGDDQMIEAPRPGMAIKQASLWIMGRPDFYARP